MWVRWPVIIVSLLPAAWVGFALWSDLTRNTRYLGANPVKEMEHFMGEWNIRFLVLTLLVSPLIKVTGWGWLIRYRRIFGLIAFLYIFLHLTIYFVLDVELDWALLVEGDRCVGWLDRDRLDEAVPSVSAAAEPLVRWITPRQTLREALEVALTSHTRVAIVQDEGRYLGVLPIERIAEQLED